MVPPKRTISEILKDITLSGAVFLIRKAIQTLSASFSETEIKVTLWAIWYCPVPVILLLWN